MFGLRPLLGLIGYFFKVKKQKKINGFDWFIASSWGSGGYLFGVGVRTRRWPCGSGPTLCRLFCFVAAFFFGIYGTRLVVRRVARSSHSRRERKRVERREKPKKKKNREEKSQQQRRRRRRRANNSSAESARWPPRWFLFLYYRPGAGSQATIPPESESIHSGTLPTGWSLPAIKLCVLGRFFFFHFFGIFFISPFFLPHLLRSLKSFALAASK